MVRNLSTVNGLPPRPIRCWRKSTGPGESSLIAIAIASSTGSASSRPEAAPATSSSRFSSREELESTSGLRPRIGQALDVVDRHRGAERVDVVGHEADLDRGRGAVANEVHHRLVARGRSAVTITRSTSWPTTSSRQVDVAEAAEVGDGSRRARRLVDRDRAHRLEPVLGMGSDLAHERVGDARLADEQHPHGAPEPEHGPPGGDPQRAREHDPRDAEGERLGDVEAVCRGAASGRPRAAGCRARRRGRAPAGRRAPRR